MEIGDYPCDPFLHKHLLSCIGKRQPYAQIQSQVKSRQKRRIIAPAKLMKYNQYEKDMTFVDLLIDGMFSLELFFI